MRAYTNMRSATLRFLVVSFSILVTALSVAGAVPPAERNALVALHESTGGDGWDDATGWLGDPGTECDWLGVMCDDPREHVVGIQLAGNGLSGTLPDALGDLTRLETLDLSRGRIGGPIPAVLGTLQALRVLDLAGNDLTGPVPPALGDLDSLEQLYLFDNDLGGTIPPSLGNLQKLVVLDLSAARLTGPIPLELTQLPALETLALGQFYDVGPRNNQLTGGIPHQLSNLTSLRSLELGFNRLGGTIPVVLADLENLERLDLAANDLVGIIPPELGRLTRLVRLTMAFNRLSGPLPAELGDLSLLTGLDAEGNELTGPIPHQLGDLKNLEDLYLNENDLSGKIPAELGNLENLEALYLHTNRLTGPIPHTFANLSRLRSLQVFGNELEGTIPTWIGNLTELTDLLLDGNRFTGPIPPQITNLTNLVALGLGGNRLEGEIPADIGDLEEMRYLSLNSAGLGGDLPASLWNMTRLIDVRLEDNDLTGTIPPEIGNLSDLYVLLLSTNRLSGPIPAEIGQLPSLEILNLDGNRFTGPIPPELSGAKSLQFLGIEKNALRGEVPAELLDLDQLGQVRFGFNALTTSNAALRNFINERQDGDPFEDTQTVPPGGITVSDVTDRSAVVSWTPIRFVESEGGYEVHATPAGGGESVVSTTGSKRGSSHIIRGLSPETSYSVSVRTTSHPFGFQQNFLRSEPGAPVSFTTTARQTIPAAVDLVSGPSGLIQVGGVPQNEDSYVLGNFGDVATTITLSSEGDHFEQEPESFVLEPGATQTIRLRSVPNQPPDSYWGHSFVSGEGVPAEFFVPVILLSTPPAVGTAIGEAVASRVDVFGLEGTDGIGTVRFRNLGTSNLRGVLVSESAWIRTAAEPIDIPPGEVRSVSFDVMRHRRPVTRGAVTGGVRLVYVASSASKGGPAPRDGETSVSTTLVTVVDTVVPQSRSAAIPDLEQGEIRRLVPGARRVVKPFGTFVTDLTVTNAFGGAAVADLEIFFDRVGSDQSSAASMGTVPPTSSLVIANVVESVYGDEDRSGTIHIRSAEQERVQIEASMSNVSGGLGEMRGALPVFRTDRVVEPGQSAYLMGLGAAGDLDTTLFVQEAEGADTSVTIEFLRGSGELIDSLVLEIGRFELRELNGAAPAGTELVRVVNHESSSGSVVTYALVVDRVSGGLMTIMDWTRTLGYRPGETVRVPIVILESEGGAGASAAVVASAEEGSRRRTVRRPAATQPVAWTSAFVMNPGQDESVIELTLHESSGTSHRQRRTIEPGAMLTIDDLVEELRGSPSSTAGYVVAEMVTGASVVSAAVIRRANDTHLVSTLPVIPDASGLRLGQDVTFAGLEDSAEATVLARRPGSFRTGFGLTETTGRPVTVRATVGFAGKSPLVATSVSKDLALGPRETLIIPDMLRGLLGEQRESVLGDMKNVQLTLTVVGGDGAVTPFVQQTENSSGDTRYRF